MRNSMAALTHLAYGSIRRDDKDARRVDACEIGAALGNHGIEPAVGALDDLRASLAGASGLSGVALGDFDSPAGELEGVRVDAREAELQHAAGTIPEQLEDLRGSGGGESGRKAMHWYARYMSEKGRGKFLGVPLGL